MNDTRGTRDEPGSGTIFFTLVALVVALLARLQSFGKGIVGGTDSFYHFRRAQLAAAGQLESFDAWTNFPFGQEIHWPRLYAEILGAVLGGPGSEALLLLPVFLGILTVAALIPWAKRLLGTWSSFALVGVALAPALAFPTAAGAIDHHALEGLLVIGAIGGAARGGVGGLVTALLTLLFGLLTVPTAPILFLPVLATIAIRRVPSRTDIILIGTTLLAIAVMIPVTKMLQSDMIRFAGESKPIVRTLADLPRSVVILGPGFLLLPLSITLWWRRREDGAAAGALAATATALPMAFFGERYVAFLAVPCVLALAEAARWAASRYGRRWAAVLFIIALLPMLRGTLEIGRLDPSPPPPIAEALTFLRDETPLPGDANQALERPAYGVVAAWDLGHEVLALGRRPAVANAFHSGKAGRELARAILFSTPNDGTRAADIHDARYLFLTSLHPLESYQRPGDPPLAETLYGRLFFQGDETLDWRRVFASKETFEFEGRVIPTAQVWERAEDGVSGGYSTNKARSSLCRDRVETIVSL